jgi:hypothetical protein
VDPAAEFLEAVEQDLLGDVLRDHQRVRILRRKPIEPDRHELAIPIADAELPSVDTEPRQSLRDADPLEHLKGPGVHDSGARGMRRCALPIDHRDVMAMPGQRGGNGQPHRPGAHHQHFGPSRKLTHDDPPSPNGQHRVTCWAAFVASGLRQDCAAATETPAGRCEAANAVAKRRGLWLRLKEVVVENVDRDRNQSTHSQRRLERDCAQPLAESLSARHRLGCDAHRARTLHQARRGSMRTGRLRFG